MATPTISVVMPALNEADSIQAALDEALAAFAELGIDGEIIVIDDGSTDGTGSLVAERMVRDARVRMVRHATPSGIGASFWHGVSEARGEIIVTLHGDNETIAVEALRYWQLLDHVDIVIPFVYHRSVRTFFRSAVSEIYRQIINTTFRTAFHYTNGMVMYRRSILDGIDSHNSGFFFQTELLIKLVNRGYLFAEVPYRVRPRSGGRSKAIGLRSLWAVTKGYLQLVYQVYFSGNPALRGPVADDSVTSRRVRT